MSTSRRLQGLASVLVSAHGDEAAAITGVAKIEAYADGKEDRERGGDFERLTEALDKLLEHHEQRGEAEPS